MYLWIFVRIFWFLAMAASIIKGWEISKDPSAHVGVIGFWDSTKEMLGIHFSISPILFAWILILAAFAIYLIACFSQLPSNFPARQAYWSWKWPWQKKKS